MKRNWWYLSLRILPLLLLALSVAHPASASWWKFHWPHEGFREGPDSFPEDAPEIDPRLAIEGLAVAGATVALMWERLRRRR
jgi:hypothetical protein